MSGHSQSSHTQFTYWSEPVLTLRAASVVEETVPRTDSGETTQASVVSSDTPVFVVRAAERHEPFTYCSHRLNASCADVYRHRSPSLSPYHQLGSKFVHQLGYRNYRRLVPPRSPSVYRRCRYAIYGAGQLDWAERVAFSAKQRHYRLDFRCRLRAVTEACDCQPWLLAVAVKKTVSYGCFFAVVGSRSVSAVAADCDSTLSTVDCRLPAVASVCVDCYCRL